MMIIISFFPFLFFHGSHADNSNFSRKLRNVYFFGTNGIVEGRTF